jgi:non-ribosomal peptide synthetase component E (peptide arylation enzyme)
MVALADDPVLRDLVLAGSARLQGCVRGADDEPLAGALLTLTDVQGEVVASTFSAPDGRYAMRELFAGSYTLAGRARDLIIRGGQNIFPSDVEHALAAHPDLAEAAVIGMPDLELGERVCAYVVLRDGRAPTLPDLVSFLRAQGLASYKLPERLELIPSLPLVPTGNKVDKRRLLDDLRQKLAAE